MTAMHTKTNDLSAQIRTLVPAQTAAEHYGFTPNRAGYICCPFHNERTPSLKFFPDGGWYCFGCHAGGSSIDFVMRLFDLDFRQAAVRLDLDFSLNLTGQRPRPVPSAVLAERRRRQRRQRELETEINALTDEHRRLHHAMIHLRPERPGDEIDPLFAEAVKRLPEIQYRLDELGKEVDELAGRNTGGGKPA